MGESCEIEEACTTECIRNGRAGKDRTVMRNQILGSPDWRVILEGSGHAPWGNPAIGSRNPCQCTHYSGGIDNCVPTSDVMRVSINAAPCRNIVAEEVDMRNENGYIGIVSKLKYCTKRPALANAEGEQAIERYIRQD